MNDSQKTFLFDLLRTPSPSGWESAGQRLWMQRMSPLADSVENDPYGNTWATRKGSSDFTLMLEAHADEIGFIVNHIDDKGFLTLAPIGGSDRTIASARRIRLFGDKGEVTAVIGNTAVHLRQQDKDKIPDWSDLYADIGAASAKEVAEMGIRVGHPGVLKEDAEELHSGRLVGRAMDNRIGGYLLTRVFEELSAAPATLPCGVVAVNAVQEEIGCQGAKMIAHRLQPRAALVFDVTHATDVPTINARKHGQVKLGGGPALSHGGANHSVLVRRLLDIAESENIPVQHEAVSRSTSTDTDVIYTSSGGIPSALISIPLRNMHSSVEIIDLKDVENAVRLVVGFIRSIPVNESYNTLA